MTRSMGAARPPWRWAIVLAVVLMASLPAPAGAEIAGWQRRAWTQADGAPGTVLSLARTPDGYLWLGAVTGLYRFDGRTFTRLPREPGPPKSEAVRALMVARNGDLWVGHDWGGVSVVRAGRYRSVGQPIDGSSVRHIQQAPDGTIVAFARGSAAINIWRLSGDRWQVSPLFDGAWLQSARFASDGTLWLVADGRVLALAKGAAGPALATARFAQEASLAVSPSGRMWLALPDALRPISLDRQGGVRIGPSLALPSTSGRQDVIFDGDDRFWRISRARGVEYFAIAAGAALREGAHSDPAAPVPQLGGAVLDAERNLWVSSASGMDQFRPSAFKIRAAPGGPAQQGGAYFVMRDGPGDVFLLDRTRLLKVTDRGEPMLIADDVPLGDVPCPSARGGIWRRTPDGFERVGAGPAQSIFVPGLPRTPLDFVTCGEDRRGGLWFSGGGYDLGYVGARGVRRVDLGFDKGYPVYQFAPQPDGAVLAYVGGGYLWRGMDGTVAPLWKDVRGQIGFAESMVVDDRGTWLGGPGGLSLYDGKTFRTASASRWPFLAFLGGMVRARDGVTWLHNADGMVALASDDLDRIVSGRPATPTLRRFGFADGLAGAAPYANRSSLTEDRWGRIWVATTAGVASLDPRAIPRNPFAPPVHIVSFRVNERPRALGAALRLPPGATRISIGYEALSLAAPGQNRFRYRLEGVDTGWIDAGQTREVTYSNLGPGHYRFRVIAANNDGVWNETGASLAFSVAPALHQTWWFPALVALAAAGLVGLLFRMRLARVAAALRAKEEERESERERISRELHDTLLQGVQGLIFSVDAAARRMGPAGAGHGELQRALGLAEKLMAEARERVRTLRLPQGPQDLKALLARQVAAANLPPTLSISLSDQDWRTAVTSEVAVELAAIAGEALTNIVRHAGASAVTIEIIRRAGDLVLIISDDGVGFTPRVLEARRRDGHFGLVGMAERASRVGARLALRNRAGGGGVVEVSLPAETAIGKPGARAWWRRIRERLGDREQA